MRRDKCRAAHAHTRPRGASADLNQSLAEGVLPASLTQLSFEFGFDHPLVEGVLPARLTHTAELWA
jgi:hypothetical protein